MMHAFSELVIGSVLVAPFVGYAVMALAIVLAIRPMLHLCRFGQLFQPSGSRRAEPLRDNPRPADGRILGRESWMVRK